MTTPPSGLPAQLPRVVDVRQTCWACPAQWEGTLDDGRMFYVRYRWGYLSVRVSPAPTTDIDDAVAGEEIFGDSLGGEFDGSMEEHDLRALTSHVLEWGGHRD